MTQEEKEHLFVFRLYDNGIIDLSAIKKRFDAGEFDERTYNHVILRHVLGFEKFGYAERQGNISQLTKSGIGRKEELIAQNQTENIEKITNEGEKTLARTVNESTIKTNSSIQILNRHQKINIWVMAIIGLFAVLVACNQLRLELKKDKQEQIREQNIEQIKSQIQIINKSLDSMRDPQNKDTTSGKK